MLARLTRKPISKEIMKPLLNQLVLGITSCCTPDEIILFGSLARNEFTDGSDIDIALIFPDPNALLTGRKQIYSQKPFIDWPLDYLFFEREIFEKRKKIGGVAMLIADDGQTLYRKSPK